MEIVALSRPTMNERLLEPKAVVSAVSVTSGKSTEFKVSEMLRLVPPVSSRAKSTLLPCTNVGIYGPPQNLANDNMNVIAPDEPAVEAVARMYRLTVPDTAFNSEVLVEAATVENVMRSAKVALSAEC